MIIDERLKVQGPRDGEAPQDGGLNIGEAARRSGLAAKTIRFYEAEGVVPSQPRTPCELPALLGH